MTVDLSIHKNSGVIIDLFHLIFFRCSPIKYIAIGAHGDPILEFILYVNLLIFNLQILYHGIIFIFGNLIHVCEFIIGHLKPRKILIRQITLTAP